MLLEAHDIGGGDTGSSTGNLYASASAVRTQAAKVSAREVILATHSPIGFHVVQAGMVPHREYGLAFTVQAGSFPTGIFWAKGRDFLSVRGLDTASQSWLIAVGDDHKVGQHDPESALASLHSNAQRRLPVSGIALRWSAQNFQSPDGLPYIGKDRSGCYIATGFATDGLTYGTVAAQIIADQILGRSNQWSRLYDATRFTPAKSARVFGKETASVVTAVIQDYLTQRQHAQLESVEPGQGAIVESDGERLAAYRTTAGELVVVSPVCTHMKCMVHWNAMETSWDCPCHGSRFATDGRVIEGPALAPLQRKRLAS